jgi:hypothetical protein
MAPSHRQAWVNIEERQAWIWYTLRADSPRRWSAPYRSVGIFIVTFVTCLVPSVGWMLRRYNFP